MPCYRPIEAWQLEDNSICFQEPKNNIRRELELPCGKCIGCRETTRREWTLRCTHEAAMHQANTFATLTYQGKVSPSLNYVDFQRFMYRVRSTLGPTRFFMCGEYGSINQRPHFHALLFGRWIPEDTLTRLWGNGYASSGTVTYQSAAYVAGYVLKKKATEEQLAAVDTRTGEILTRTPEFRRMSLKPGIGATWWEKYWRETAIPRDGIVQPGGFKLPAPRYYDKMLKRKEPEIRERIDFERDKNRERFRKDQTRARLRDREKCTEARIRFRENRKI